MGLVRMKNKLFQIPIWLFALGICGCAVFKTENNALMRSQLHAESDSFLVHLLHQYPQYFDTLLKQNEIWEIQIVYTQIDRDRKNKSHFKHYYFNTESG